MCLIVPVRLKIWKKDFLKIRINQISLVRLPEKSLILNGLQSTCRSIVVHSALYSPPSRVDILMPTQRTVTTSTIIAARTP